MRILILCLLLCGTAHADPPVDAANPYAPHAFESTWAMDQWANSTAGGARMTELAYKEHKLEVYFRSYTSGLPTSEPVVFVEKGGRWIQVLSAMMCRFEMEATIERESLILWRLDWPEGKRTRTEFLRFDLANLDAA